MIIIIDNTGVINMNRDLCWLLATFITPIPKNSVI